MGREQLQRVGRRDGAEVQEVVVGDPDDAGPYRLQRSHGLRRTAKEEGLLCDQRRSRTSRRQTALKVADHEIERAQELTQTRLPELCRVDTFPHGLPDTPAKHHVAQQADPDTGAATSV